MKLTFTTRALVLTTALLTLASFYASADRVVYRWKDDAGNPVNSDRPPPQGTDYEVVSTRSSFVREVDAQEGVVPLEVEPTAEKDSQVADAKNPAVEKNPEYCEQATKNLEVLNSKKARIRVPDGNGSFRYIDEDEKAKERSKAEEIIAQHCE